MAQNIQIIADIHHDSIDEIVNDLTCIVEREVVAFQRLLNILLKQNKSIIQGEMNHLAANHESVKQSELIPLVKEQYSVRLQDLKDMLVDLSQKIQYTDMNNQYLLENSLQFINDSLQFLLGINNSGATYNTVGPIDVEKRISF